MRKLLASLLATAMIASIGATMSFAAGTKPALQITASTGVKPTVAATAKTIVLRVGTDKYEQAAKVAHVFPTSGAAAAADIAAEFKDAVFSNVEIDGRRFDVSITTNADKLTATLDAPYAIAAGTVITLDLLDTTGASIIATANPLTFTFDAAHNGSGNQTVDDVDSTSLKASDVFVCGPDGNPLGMTETANGVDKDQNDDDGVQSDNTVYFMVKDNDKRFEDDKFWKMRINKGDNGKYVKAVSDVTKNFGSKLVSLDDGRNVDGSTGRHRFIKVELNEILTDDEYKINLDVTFTPKSAAVDNKNILLNGNRITDDVSLKIKDFSFYVKNIVKTADNDWKVGVNGLMLDPLGNDWNNIVWYDEDGDLAHLKFFADSDSDKFYSKLSTKWNNEDYASYFNDQDAYKFEFTGSPTISSTSRTDLEIYNPFVDEDGNETIDPTTATIYQVVDGELFPVTDSFSYAEGDNGDMAYKTRTRMLGTYIICEKEVEEAADTAAPDEIAPDEIAPDEVTPDAKPDNGGKAPANTGRYI